MSMLQEANRLLSPDDRSALLTDLNVYGMNRIKVTLKAGRVVGAERINPQTITISSAEMEQLRKMPEPDGMRYALDEKTLRDMGVPVDDQPACTGDVYITQFTRTDTYIGRVG